MWIKMRHTVKTNELKSITENKEEISITDILFYLHKICKKSFHTWMWIFLGKKANGVFQCSDCDFHFVMAWTTNLSYAEYPNSIGTEV